MPSSSAVESSSSKLDTENAVDTSLLKELAKRSLVDALNSVNGAKTLVLDPSIAGPLGLVTEVSLLKHHGVDKMFWLEAGPLSATTTNIVYFCRPLIKCIKIIADQIKRHAQTSQKHTYTLFLVPRTSTLATRILEEEGVLGEIAVSSYNLQFIPLEDDVISLEYDMAFKEIWVDGDETVIYDSAQALATLQRLYGLFPRMVAKGDQAARLTRLLSHNLPPTSHTHTPETHLAPSEKIDALVVLDRQVDLVTPLLTQLTYEGLVDELLGIKNSQVELPTSLLSPPTDPNPAASTSSATPPSAPLPKGAKEKEKKKKHHLTAGNDPLFRELRDLNFAHVGRRLSRVARRLEEDYKGRLKAKTVAQLKDFVGKLGGLQTEHQSLKLHTGLSELLMPLTRSERFGKSLEIQQNLLSSYDTPSQLAAIEDLIAQGADQRVVLRLMCLASLTADGIKTKVFENLKREVLQAYGYGNLPLLINLTSSSLLLPSPLPPYLANASPPPRKSQYALLRKTLRLVVEDQEAETTAKVADAAADQDLERERAEDRDMSYTYSGYAPLSCRLVQCVAQKGGVLAPPSATRVKQGADDGEAELGRAKVRAHPIAGWKGFEDVVAQVPGESVYMDSPSHSTHQSAPTLGRPLNGSSTTTTVVFFLGGCTFTEIAAIRWMGRQTKGRKFLIATTSIINGNTLIDAFGATAGPVTVGR
ncbi:Sec1-like protein [Gautieria morchelliformis]|nr:Sec1-like protein [Gautieria morchelliformis]